MIIAYSILLAAILIVAFFLCLKAYILGLKHGKQLVNKEIPEAPKLGDLIGVKDPIAYFKEKKEEEKIESAIEDYWS